MEKVTEALLTTALRGAGSQLQKRLSSSDGLALTALMEDLARRYPSQETADAMPAYMRDYAKLVQKYSLQSVSEAVEALRINPEQKFFPAPNEVAEMIEVKAEMSRYRSDELEGKYRREQHSAYVRHLRDDPTETAWRISHFGYDTMRYRSKDESDAAGAQTA